MAVRFQKEFRVTKADSLEQAYSGEKLVHSLTRAGAPHALAHDVRAKIERELGSRTTTETLFRKVSAHLLREDPVIAAKYSLKQAIMELGPAGFLFERYVAGILSAYGYRTMLNQIMQGMCVSHEIDVLAEKGTTHFLIEAKYHNERGVKSDIKTIMYTYARAQDIGEEERRAERGAFEHRAWLFTNTKLTSKAITFGTCRDLRMTGWRYPAGEGLEALIEEKGLYPVTILPSLSRFARERLAGAKVLFVRDLQGYSAERLTKNLGIDVATARAIVAEAAAIGDAAHKSIA